MTAKEIGKWLFEHHHHDEWDGIIYEEKDILELLKLLGHPEPDWDWWKDNPKLGKEPLEDKSALNLKGKMYK